MHLHDCIIIGGGPAGYSAAIYLSRALRDVLVCDASGGRTRWNQINDNYPGFPSGIKAQTLLRRMRKQAHNFGAQTRDERVLAVRATGETFEVDLDGETLGARTLIFATGVTDHWPDFPGVKHYVGHSLFWCLYCDGFRAQDKRIVVLAPAETEAAATLALQLRDYSDDVVLLMPPAATLQAEQRAELEGDGIEIYVGHIESARGRGGQLEALVLSDGRCLELDVLFSALGQTPNSELARELGLELAEAGCILTDAQGKTRHAGVYAAGDVICLASQQIVSAVHQGALAATNANFHLRPPRRRENSDARRELPRQPDV